MISDAGNARKVQPLEFLWLGLYAFAGFSIELLLGIMYNGLGFAEVNKGLNLHSLVLAVSNRGLNFKMVRQEASSSICCRFFIT